MAPRGHPGGPWGPQDGRGMVASRILLDLGVILGPVYVSFSKLEMSFLFRACFQVILLSISESSFRRLGLANRGFRFEGIARICFVEIVFNEFRDRFLLVF